MRPDLDLPVCVRFMGFDIAAYAHPSEIHTDIAHFIRSRRKALILSVNVHAVNLAYRHEWFRALYQRADRLICDGAGVRLGARLLGQHIPTRITYADWIWSLCAFLQQEGFSLYLLGGRVGVAERAAAQLCAQFPQLNIVGTHHGYFDHAPDSAPNQAVVDSINHAKPDILLVCMGMPLQERWLLENWTNLRAYIGLNGGAVLDYVAGDLRRPPRWMCESGLEWLGRLLIEPRRLWSRYLIGNPLFAAHLVQAIWRERFSRPDKLE